MELFLSQVLNGLSIGQVYALIALGFSLIFGVANIVNFAQGALFMLGAFLAFTGITWFGWPVWLAVAGSVASVAGFGLALERIALRPLAGGPSVAPLLSTLAIGIIVDQSAEIIWTPDSQPFPAPFGNLSVVVGRAFITGADILITVVGLSSLLLLTWFITRSWTGRALRATAQDPDAAAQTGVDVDRVRQFAFGMAGGLGALSGVLAAFYFQSVFPQMGLPFGLKGFAAAVLGGITSLPGAVAGGILLGVMETLASAYFGESYRDTVAYSLLLVLLVFRPAGLFGSNKLDALGGGGAAAGSVPTTSLLADHRSNRSQIRVLESPLWGIVVAGAAIAVLPLLADSRYVLQAVSGSLIFALLAVSVTLCSGTAGILSIGHAAFFGVGAYATAIAAKTYGLPAEIVLPIAGLLSGLVAAGAAIPLLRLSGHTVALGTLAIGQIGALTFLNWLSVTRGPSGISNIPHATLAALGDLRLSSGPQRFYGILAVVVLGILVASRFASSPVGRVWRAIREDRLAAVMAGIPVARYLLLVFAVSGCLAGLAGSLFAYLQTVVSPESFTVETSILLLIMAVLGGLGNVTGAAIAGFVLALLPEVLRGFDDYRMIVYGLLLLLALRLRPQGLFGAR